MPFLLVAGPGIHPEIPQEIIVPELTDATASRLEFVTEDSIAKLNAKMLAHGKKILNMSVCDWKAKWLSEVFREPMSDFFGKTGIPFHGAMFYVATTDGSLQRREARREA